MREVRRKLTPHLKKARSEDQKAFMVFDHLVIENKKFYIDEHDQLTEAK